MSNYKKFEGKTFRSIKYPESIVEILKYRGKDGNNLKFDVVSNIDGACLWTVSKVAFELGHEEVVEHCVYVIYKDGIPMESNKAGIKRNCYTKKGDANGVVTNLCEDAVRQEFGYFSHHDEKYKILMERERLAYKVMKYSCMGEA